MPSDHARFPVDRRALLRGAFLLVGAVGIAPAVLAQTGKTFFTPDERAALDLLSETIIPRTDTPGAIGAGVPAFLEELMANWASPESQDRLRGIIARLSRSAETEGGKPLALMTPQERTLWLGRQDAMLLAAGDQAYHQFKQLVLIGYYQSEVGATQELRYELVPGVWDPAVPITPDTRAWA